MTPIDPTDLVTVIGGAGKLAKAPSRLPNFRWMDIDGKGGPPLTTTPGYHFGMG